MYSIVDYPSKKALKSAVAAGPVPCYQPGIVDAPVPDGVAYLSGPHYPAPHRFYARVRVVGGHIVKVIS